MKLWLLRPRHFRLTENGFASVPGDWHVAWADHFAGFVIRAETEQRAREIAQALAVKQDSTEAIRDGREIPAWMSSEHSTCEELVAEGPEGFVMVDLHS